MLRLFTLVFLVLAYADMSNADEIKFPGKFYTTELNTCSALNEKDTFKNISIINTVKGLVGYDWPADHTANSNSITVKHDNITIPIKKMMTATHQAIANDNTMEIKIAIELLIDIAEADTLYDSIGAQELKGKPMCWQNNNPFAPCPSHEHGFAAGVFSNYMITALWLKDELTKKEYKIVNSYIKKMYKKFLLPRQMKPTGPGIYQMANGGLSTLVYASWTNDKKLALKEINYRLKIFDKRIFDDGYIDNNSFRGYRSQWYHSYGLNVVLGYVYIADLWGVTIPNKLQQKIVKASNLVNLAITDKVKFRSRAKTFTGKTRNAINDPSKAIPHTHQMAIAIDTLMLEVAGVTMLEDPLYLSKRKWHTVDGIDDLIGFNPNCIKKRLN
jgi:hypothetical protein